MIRRRVRMLLRLQGREHEVATGIAVWHGGLRSGVERVRVRFRAFDEETARLYARRASRMDKAGAYGIQGYGSTLVEASQGTTSPSWACPSASWPPGRSHDGGGRAGRGG
jgi:predicted house-cleaning NTP pyrophosphatase (Maf/HAM1 superfamily)